MSDSFDIIKPHDCGTCVLYVPVGEAAYAGIVPRECVFILNHDFVRDNWGSHVERASNCPLDHTTMIDLNRRNDYEN